MRGTLRRGERQEREKEREKERERERDKRGGGGHLGGNWEGMQAVTRLALCVVSTWRMRGDNVAVAHARIQCMSTLRTV